DDESILPVYISFSSLQLSESQDAFCVIVTDLTEQKRKEEIVAAEKLARSIIEQATEAIVVCDKSGKIIRFSHAVFRILGCDPSLQIFEDVFDLKHPIGKKLLPVSAALRGEVLLQAEASLERGDGILFHLLLSAGPLKSADGNIIGCVVTITDITERKRSEEALRVSEEKFRTSVESFSDGFALCSAVRDETGRIVDFRYDYINEAGAKLNQLSRTEHLGKTMLELSPSAKSCKLFGDYIRITEVSGSIQEYVTFEDVYGDDNQQNRIFDFRATKLGDGFVVVWRDITERMQAEKALRLNEEKAEIISNAINRLLASDSPQTIVAELCLRVMEFLDCQAFFNYLMVEEKGCLHLNAYAGIPSEKASEIEWLDLGVAVCGGVARDGTRIVVENIPEANDSRADLVKSFGIKAYACHPLLNQGQVIGTLSFGTSSRTTFNDEDLSLMKTVAEHVAIAMARIKNEEELHKAKDELELRVHERTADLVALNLQLLQAKKAAEDAAEAKATFLANMSHELRTPMNAVIGFSSLLLDGNITSEQQEYIEGIRRGGEALLALVNDILDFTKADKEKLELEHHPISLRHCIEEALDMVATQANKKNLNLAYTVCYGTPDIIIGDHGRLRQVLVNLLGNAVKFTDKGEITVSVSAKSKENKSLIHFNVSDTGIGISKNKLNTIFEPFVQAERVISRKRDGVGLGLAISKRLVELMDGKIWAESIPGKGSTFHFTILAEVMSNKDLLVEQSRMDSSESLAGHKSLSILIAEDNPSNQRVLVEMLKKMGYRPDAVSDGKEVLHALELRPFELIFMDIKMPEMDGITATREIRKRWPENGPKIIAITAYALEGDREMCLKAGMDDYIAKPILKKDLIKVLTRYSQKK
ncbi:MAG: ATP-binding protein, partial [Methanothrix sp.]|nr:ATP-binding protein [Methanothrix sp.]